MRNLGRQIERMIGTPRTQRSIGMNSCVIGAVGPLLENMNRNVLIISIIRIGSLENFSKPGPFSPEEKPPNCS